MVEIREIPEGTDVPEARSLNESDSPTDSVNLNSELRPVYDVVNFVQSLIDATVDVWSSLDSSWKQTIVVGFFALYIFSYYWINILLLWAVYQYVSTQKPKQETFLPFFEQWFKTVYYPKVLKRMETEIQQKRMEKEKSGQFLQSLGEAFKGHLLNKTKDIQTQVFYQQIIQQSSPIIISDMGLFLQAQMNIGSEKNPSMATFWGLHNKWYLAPYLSIDFDTLDLAIEEDS
mmetsp:Transcript_3382/g.3826  ORF Transcript_3382/g.3826 Transcript_3382/m.3826 type:complete len:231 (-) Transcript_3382:189-881(-)